MAPRRVAGIAARQDQVAPRHDAGGRSGRPLALYGGTGRRCVPAHHPAGVCGI